MGTRLVMCMMGDIDVLFVICCHIIDSTCVLFGLDFLGWIKDGRAYIIDSMCVRAIQSNIAYLHMSLYMHHLMLSGPMGF